MLKRIFAAFCCISSFAASAQFVPDSNSCYSNAFGLQLQTSSSRITACEPINISVSYTGNPFIYWSNGNFGDVQTIYQTGTYYAFALDSAGCYDTTASVYVDIQKDRIWAYSNTFNTSFCAGSSLRISVASTYPGEWNTSEKDRDISVTKGGKYYYITTSDSGCKDTSNVLDITEVTVAKPKITIKGNTTICRQDTTWLETTSRASISWNPFGFGEKIRATATGMYYAIATEYTLGCTTNSDTVFITVHEPSVESLCMVTNDSNSGRNILMWKKSTGKRIVKYEIYRETNNFGEFAKIGTVDYTDNPRFTDSTSNPRQRAYSYYLKAVDSCGNSSDESQYYVHTTSHLTASLGVSGENNLNWSPYNGVYPQSGYAIYRSNNGGAFQELDKVSTSKTSYSDLNPPQGTNRYYIAIIADVDCGNIKGNVRFRSNQVQFGTLSADGTQALQFSLYPNPASSSLQVNSVQAAPYVILDVAGRTLTQGTLVQGNNTMDVSGLNNGVYMLVVNGKTARFQVQR